MKNRLYLYKCILLFLIFFFLPLTAKSQDRSIDKLVNINLDIAENLFYEGKFIEGKKYLKLSFFKDLKAFNSKHNVAIISKLTKIGLYQNRLARKPENQIEILRKIKTVSPLTENLNDNSLLATYYDALASAYLENGDRDNAGNYYKKALDLYTEMKDYYNIVETNSRIIMVKHQRFRSKKDNPSLLKLIPIYLNQIEAALKVGNKFALSFNTRHLGYIYYEQSKNYTKALKYLKQSLELRKEIKFKPYIPPSYSSLGDIYKKKGETKSAIKMYIYAIKAAQEVNFVRYMIYPRLMLGDIYIKMNNQEKAKNYYIKALKAASLNGDLKAINETVARINSLIKLNKN